MGCSCLKTLSDEPEILRISIESIPLKETSQITPKLYPNPSPLLEVSPDPVCLFSVSSFFDVPTILQYNINTQSLTEIECKTSLFIDSGLIPLSPNQLFFAGGADIILNKEVSTCIIVNTETQEITYPSALNSVKRRPRLVLSSDNIYCIGGVREIKTKSDTKISIKQCYLHNFERFSIDRNEWEILQDLPQGVEYPACEILNKKIFVFGGGFAKEEEFEVTDKIQVFSIEKSQWEVLAVKIKFPFFGGVALNYNEKIVVFGGIDGEEERTAPVFVFNGIEEQVVMECTGNMFFGFYCKTVENKAFVFNDEDQVACLDLNNFTVDIINN